MSRFAHLDKRKAGTAAPKAEELTPPAGQPVRLADTGTKPKQVQAERAPAARAKAREGKKPVIGYFSEDLSRELRMLSAQEGRTMQALLGEAIDLLMTDRGRNRFNER